MSPFMNHGTTGARIQVPALLLLAGVFALGVVFAVQRMKAPTVTPAGSAFGRAPVFLLTDQNGEPYRSASLDGQVWMVDFFFTRCRSICPILTGKMLDIQAALGDAPGYRLLSITVDPLNDTPEVLRAYAAEKGADPARWTFLTGDKPYVYELIQRGFLAPVDENAGTPDMPILHSPRIVLVDRDGSFRGFYDAMVDGEVDRLIAEARRLLANGSSGGRNDRHP